MGAIDDESLSYFGRLITLIERGDCDVSLLNNYRLHYRLSTWENIIRINDQMYHSDVIDKAFVIDHLERNSYGVEENEFVKTIPNIEDKLLNYPFDEHHLNIMRTYSRLVEKLLVRHRPEFAKNIHSKIMSYLNTNYRGYNYDFEKLYFALLPKYEDVIIDDVLNAFASPSEYLLYTYNVENIIGSGLGSGRGILFQCDNEKIKLACLQNPETLPSRMAKMCPIYNCDDTGCKNELSDFAMWLINNFGWNKTVLDSFASNFGTYSYSGDNNMAPFFDSRRKIFEPLFEHENAVVAEWAKTMYDCETHYMEKELVDAEYREMLYRE